MKLLFKILILLIVFAFAWNYASSISGRQPLFILSDESGSFSVNIREPEKTEFKGAIKKIENLVYHEATVHNPPGDMLPDNIDNNLIKETKQIVN